LFKDFFEAISSHSSYQVEKESENESLYSVDISFVKLGNIKESVENLYKIIPSRDKCILSLSLDHLDPIQIHNQGDLDHFETKVKDEFFDIADEQSKFYLNLRVNKQLSENLLSFYSLSLFKEFLFSKTINEGLSFFDHLIKEYNNIHILILDESLEGTNLLRTSSISISWNVEENSLPNFNSIDKVKRNKILDKQRSVSNIVNDKTRFLIPDDIRLEENTYNDEDLEMFLNNLCFCLSIGFIFDVVDVTENKLTYKIHGYKSIEGVLDFAKTNIYNMDQVSKIYEWVYSDGNISDKIGLARNIISLNLTHDKQEDIFYLSDSTYNSIQSGYEIYLKENVARYIDVKNKVSEFMINKSIESSTLIRDFTNSLKNNNYLYVSFFLSFIIFKSLKPTTTSIFTKEIVFISLGILGISILYLILNAWTINEDKKRFENQYERLKRIYSDLLNDEDISSIFLESEKEEDLSYIKRKRNFYMWVWGSEILILLLIVLILAEYNSVFDISRWIASLF
jgi:hypothetical protein